MITKLKYKFPIFLLSGLLLVVNIPRVMAQYTSSNQVCTQVGDTEEKSPCQGPGNLVYYCQGGPPWGDTCDLGEAGCGPSSLAMIISSFGVTMTPPQVDAVFRASDHNWRGGCNGLSDDESAINSPWFRDLGFSHGPELTGRDEHTSRVLDTQKAREYLANGYFILGSSQSFPCANCKPGTTVVSHIFVIDAVDESGNIRVRDPNNCNYMPGDGAEREIRTYKNGDFPWYYAIPIKKTS
jgi:hypothetical protein